MKNIYTLLVALIISGSLTAQTPQSFKYQAVVRDASGNVVADQAVSMQISILQGSTSGTAVYVETFTPTTNDFGLINLNIGAGTLVSGDLTTIDWSIDTYFIKVEMDITGGTTYEEYGTSQLLSVPYALHAKTAANIFSGNYSDLTGRPTNLSTFTNDAGYLTSFTETDPVFGAHAANGITSTNITNWTTAYGWGDHSLAGYLTSFTEADPNYCAWDKSTGISITENQITDLDHFTTADETDPVFGAWDKSTGISITESQISDLDHFTTADETDPVYGSSVASGITGTDTTNWNNKQDQLTAGTGIDIAGNVVSATSSVTTYSVGDFAQGGIVFWVDETGQHGLVAAKEDQSTGVRWYAGTYGNTQAKGDGPFAGEANTSIIIAAQVAIGDDGSTYAARICNELQVTEGGKTYGDWYLPSKEELNLMYQNKATIDATAGANGGSGIASASYWSSTEYFSFYAWLQYFDDGHQDGSDKFSTFRVRAVRAF